VKIIHVKLFAYLYMAILATVQTAIHHLTLITGQQQAHLLVMTAPYFPNLGL
jgi:hypothetical protein